ncbi:MAG: hypothetical protein ABIG61_03285 [Planctomycetota bacterium]
MIEEKTSKTLQEREVISFASAEKVLAERYLRFKPDLSGRLSKHDMVWGEPSGPPASWKEGAPVGNGDFGALIYGYPDNLSFVLGKTDVWDRSGKRESRFPKGTFKEFKKTYLDDDEDAFKRFCDTIDNNANVQHATTAGMFRLHIRDAASIVSPGLRVSLWEGVSRLQFKPSGIETDLCIYDDTCVEMFASREYRTIAIRVDPANCPLGLVGWELSRDAHQPHPPAVVNSDEEISWLEQNFVTGEKYIIAFTTVGCQSHAFVCGDRLVGDICPDGLERVIIYLTIVSSDDNSHLLEEAKARLKRARSAGFDKIRQEHAAWWANYWRKAYVCIGDADVEKWWYTSLYLSASTIEPGCQSLGLQGVWIKENVPAWWGDYHSNVNLQAEYWQLLTSNRVEYFEPYVRHLLSIAEQCRKDTQRYFNMRGIRFPHACTIEGYELTTSGWANLGVSIGGSSWLTQLIWQVYQYTEDISFLCDIAYPLLKEVAQFYEDYLVWDDTDERWVLEPSLHFEALCPGFKSWGKNSLYELTLVYGAFQRAIAAAKKLQVDEPLQKKWEDILSKLSDFPTTPDGKSWIAFEGFDVRQFGSHQFSVPPAFPGELISLWHGPQHWRDQALETLKHPLNSGSMTGKPWCGGQGVRELIRLGFVERAFEAAKWVPVNAEHSSRPISERNNTNGLNHNWRTHSVQADHGLGMASVLSDMLLLNTGGTLRLFSCFPENVSAAFHSLRAPGAFLVSAEKRDEQLDYAIIQSLAGNTLKIANPWQERIRARDIDSDELLIISDACEIEIPTRPGQVIVLDRPEIPYESIKEIRI